MTYAGTFTRGAPVFGFSELTTCSDSFLSAGLYALTAI